ncbi:uncharacterized protein LOC143283797 [Babylonia areolata]|uniref:uncharacterized protein LOC143283797 n=1 Tax=Babylonia areolata TaxID=304850 RepID=UPI003FD55586
MPLQRVAQCVLIGTAQILQQSAAACNSRTGPREAWFRQALCQSPMITSGKEFVLAFPIPEDMDVENHRLLFVSNPSSSSAATVTVAVPKEQNAAGLKNISDHQVRPVSSVVMSYGMKDDVIHVCSDQDIVVQIVVLSEENGTTPTSSAATLIYPTSTLHKKYWVSSTCNSSRCFITIVAAEEGETTVNVTVRVEPQGHSVFFEGTRYQNNSVINHEIQQFQVMRLQCEDPQCDLSGTRVQSSKPVAVFVGAIFNRTGFAEEVMQYEQIPPILYCHDTNHKNQRCLPTDKNYTYILAPLWKDEIVEEVKFVVRYEDILRLDARHWYLSAPTSTNKDKGRKVHRFTITGSDTEVQTLTAYRRIILMQTTRFSALMPLPVNFWASSCFLALPEDNRLTEDMEVEVVILLSSWAEDCLHTTDDGVLLETLQKAMNVTRQWAQVGQPAVVRAHVDRGTRAVIHSRCGPISAYLSAWSLQHGWTMALGSVRSMMNTTSASSSTSTDCTKVQQTKTLTFKHTIQLAVQPQPMLKTLTTHTATTETHVTDPTTNKLLSSHPVTSSPTTARTDEVTTDSSTTVQQTANTTSEQSDTVSHSEHTAQPVTHPLPTQLSTGQSLNTINPATKSTSESALTAETATKSTLAAEPSTAGTLQTQLSTDSSTTTVTTRLETLTTHMATTETHVTDPTATNLLSPQPVTGEPMTAQPVTTKLVSDPSTVTTPQTAEPGTSPTAHQVTAEVTIQSESTESPATKKKPFLCPCSAKVRANQKYLAATIPQSGPERKAFKEAIRQEIHKALAVNKTTLSRTRRSKLSEGDVKIAYGIGIGLVLLTMLQLLHSAYNMQKCGVCGKRVRRGKIEPLEKRDDRGRHRKRSKVPRIEEIV